MIAPQLSKPKIARQHLLMDTPNESTRGGVTSRLDSIDLAIKRLCQEPWKNTLLLSSLLDAKRLLDKSVDQGSSPSSHHHQLHTPKMITPQLSKPKIARRHLLVDAPNESALGGVTSQLDSIDLANK